MPRALKTALLFVAGVVVLLGIMLVTVEITGGGHRWSTAELGPGTCLRELPPARRASVTTALCEARQAAFVVVFNEVGADDPYPANLDELGARCTARGGQLVAPERSIWNGGYRRVICVVPHLA